MPEAKPLILAHAEWGEKTRTATVTAAISALVALAFYRARRFRRILAFITAIIAAWACYCAWPTRIERVGSNVPASSYGDRAGGREKLTFAIVGCVEAAVPRVDAIGEGEVE